MNTEYWESKFKTEGTLWQFEPSDSALLALDIFQSHNIGKILIPGVGYGRNAKIFLDQGFDVTGIEIARSAIELAGTSGLHFKIHHGSVTSMPFDNELYDGIFCYALIHLLNKPERKTFLQACYNQLKPGGIMIFTIVSTESDMYGKGRKLSKDRYEIDKGLKVFFYDSEALVSEFTPFGIFEWSDIDEPVKFNTGYPPIKCRLVVCRKTPF